MSRLREDGLVISRYDWLLAGGAPAKVIQLYVDGTKPVLFLGRELHSEALELILQMLNLDYETGRIPNGHQGPLLAGQDYNVVGMGHAEFDEKKIAIKGNSNSFGYGIGIDPKHLEDVKPYLKSFELEVV